MGEITILSKKYSLPDTTEHLQELTQEIQHRLQIVKNNAVPVPKLIGLFSRRPKKLSVESRFSEIEKLIANYAQVINQLRENKDKYLEFFASLSADVERAMKERARQIREAEEERRRIQEALQGSEDHSAISWIQEQEERLREAVRVLGSSALLLLKKLSLCKRGIEALTTDQEMQRKLLERLRNMLALHRRMYGLEQKISQIEYDVKQMAQMALHFEAYLQDYFGPLQELLDQVFKVDKSLTVALVEIETIAKDLSQKHGHLNLPENVLDILVGPQLERDRVQQLAESLSYADGNLDRFDTELATHRASVEDGIVNITSLVESRLEQLWGVEVVCANCEAKERHRSTGGAYYCSQCKAKEQRDRSPLLGREEQVVIA